MNADVNLTAPDVCVLIGKVFAYLDQHPDGGRERLEAFLNDDKVLLDTEGVAKMTGWCEQYINRLCRRGDLPYIPGKPHKFMMAPLMSALRQLQVGGEYGRRKSRTLNKKVKKAV